MAPDIVSILVEELNAIQKLIVQMKREAPECVKMMVDRNDQIKILNDRVLAIYALIEQKGL